MQVQQDKQVLARIIKSFRIAYYMLCAVKYSNGMVYMAVFREGINYRVDLVIISSFWVNYSSMKAGKYVFYYLQLYDFQNIGHIFQVSSRKNYK